MNSTAKSLAAIGGLTREDPDFLGPASAEFEGTFYLEKDQAVQQAMLDPGPIQTRDARNDAWLGAISEHLAQRWGLEVPPWTQEAAFLNGQRPSFWPDETLARDIQIVETLPAFRRRLLFTYAEPQMNAKVPADRKVRMPF